MATKRTKIGPRRINRAMPPWARHYVKTGEPPERDTPEHDQYVGWRFFNEPVPGLPDEGTEEGKALWSRERG